MCLQREGLFPALQAHDSGFVGIKTDYFSSVFWISLIQP